MRKVSIFQVKHTASIVVVDVIDKELVSYKAFNGDVSPLVFGEFYSLAFQEFLCQLCILAMYVFYMKLKRNLLYYIN